MDLRVLVLTADSGLAALLRTQVENLGCTCSTGAGYEEAAYTLDWADAAIVDLAGDGIDNLSRLRVEVPRVRILAIVPSPDDAAAARTAGADGTLVEPFSIAALGQAVRDLDDRTTAQVIDLREGDARPFADLAETPWWASS